MWDYRGWILAYLLVILAAFGFFCLGVVLMPHDSL